jgi:hypothetical protein
VTQTDVGLKGDCADCDEAILRDCDQNFCVGLAGVPYETFSLLGASDPIRNKKH